MVVMPASAPPMATTILVTTTGISARVLSLWCSSREDHPSEGQILDEKNKYKDRTHLKTQWKPASSGQTKAGNLSRI